jgi:putative ABC transport system substrate-binding protein
VSAAGKWNSALLCGCLALTAAQALGSGVLVVKGPNSAPYREAANGFRQAYPDGIEIDQGNKRELARRLQSDRPDLIVAIGREAVEAANEGRGQVPLVFTMVPNLARAGLSGGNIAGISMEIPGDLQLARIHELLPLRTAIAVLHNPARVASVVAQAQSAADRLGVHLEPVAVETPAEVRQRFNMIKPIVEAVWVVPDEFATTATVWEFLLKETTRVGLPLFFTNGEAAVERGALASLVVDYRDLGRQCGQLVREITTGKVKLPEIGIKPPETVRWIVNLNTASKIGVTIPQKILDSAKKYR